MKNVKKIDNVKNRQIKSLLILSTILFSIGIGVILQQFAGMTFTPLLKPSVALTATILYTLVVFVARCYGGVMYSYLMQAILAALIGFALDTNLMQSEKRMDYQMVIVATFIIMIFHDLCVDRILNKLGKITDRVMTGRLVMCIILSMFSIGGYVYSLKHNPKSGVTTTEEKTLELPKATPVNLPVAKPITVVTKVTEFFMGIYQNAREFEKVIKIHDEICGYPREWIDQLKSFENSPLHNGDVKESTVHKDKLRSDVLEVGYGTTPGEIADAKRYGFLKKDAEFPKSMTKDEADRWMEEVTIPTYDAMVRDMVKVDLTLQQRFALLSFCHNTGGGNLEKLACYKNRLNSGNLECAPKLIRLYVNAGSHKNVSGLIKRRNWEANLFEESLGEVASN